MSPTPILLGASASRRNVCSSAHIVHTAARLAEIRTTAAECVLPAAMLEAARESARLLFPSLGLEQIAHTDVARLDDAEDVDNTVDASTASVIEPAWDHENHEGQTAAK